jgi:hypothetical protein
MSSWFLDSYINSEIALLLISPGLGNASLFIEDSSMQ